MRLLIVRHGETTANAAGICQGQSLNPDYKLTELGMAQARAGGEALETGELLRDHGVGATKEA